MTIRKTATLAVFLALLLAGCGDDRAPEAAKSGDVGELTGGTINDDMLPLAEVQSQSPMVKSEPSSDDDDASEDSDAEADASTDADSGANSGADSGGGEN